MAGDWIPIRINLHDDPAVLQMAARLNVTPLTVVGALVRVWGWANANLSTGNAPSVTCALLDSLTGVTGFAHAMAAAGWLVIHPEDGAGDADRPPAGIEFPNFERWNSQGAKRRALAGRRVASHRAKCNAGSVTKSAKRNAGVTLAALQDDDASVTGALTREEKRREEKKDNTPLPPTGGGGVEGEDANEARDAKRGEDVPIPPRLDREPFRSAWAEWLRWRRAEKRKPVTPSAADRAFRIMAGWTPEKAAFAVDQGIARDWQGLFEPTGREWDDANNRPAGGRPGGPVGRACRAEAPGGKYADLDAAAGPATAGGAAGGDLFGPAGHPPDTG